MKTPQKKISGIFRIPLYLVAGAIAYILVNLLLEIWFSGEGVVFYSRKEHELPPAPAVAAPPKLADIPTAASWGKVLNPGRVIPEKGFDVWYLTTGNPDDVSHPVRERGINLQKSAAGPVRFSMEGLTNRWAYEPERLIAKEHVNHIRVLYAYDEFKRIPSPDFAAYWVGWLNIPERGEYEFVPEHSWASVRILLDGHCIYEGHEQRDSRSQHSVQLEPGRYLLEVEMANSWHTTDFGLTVNLLKEAP